MRTTTPIEIITVILAFSVTNAEDIPLPKDSPQYGQWLTGAGLKGEPVGDQPSVGLKPSIADFKFQVKYQAAFQTMLWSMPAAEIYRFRGATMEAIKADATTILSLHNTASPRLESNGAKINLP